MNGWLDPANYGFHSRQYLGHTFRYFLARGYLESKDIALDVACGVGYGSQILSSNCKSVIGCDVDKRALKIAKEKYDASNILWIQSNLDQSNELPKADVAISFETIEHLENPEHFAQLLKESALRLIVVSTPVIPTVGINPHHKHDFTEDSIKKLFLTNKWTLWEEVRQGPYLILVCYRDDRILFCE